MHQALWYELGPEGFINAIFENDIEYTTEVPNDQLKDGAILKMPPPPPTRPPTKRKADSDNDPLQKKPAARIRMKVSAKGPADDLAHAEEAIVPQDDAPLVDPAAAKQQSMHLKIVAKHESDEWCVNVCTKSKDKAHVLRCKGNVAKKDLMFDAINQGCAAWIDAHKHMRVGDVPKAEMAELRAIAVSSRNAFVVENIE